MICEERDQLSCFYWKTFCATKQSRFKATHNSGYRYESSVARESRPSFAKMAQVGLFSNLLLFFTQIEAFVI